MKNVCRFLAIIALAAGMGVSAAACGDFPLEENEARITVWGESDLWGSQYKYEFQNRSRHEVTVTIINMGKRGETKTIRASTSARATFYASASAASFIYGPTDKVRNSSVNANSPISFGNR